MPYTLVQIRWAAHAITQSPPTEHPPRERMPLPRVLDAQGVHGQPHWPRPRPPPSTGPRPAVCRYGRPTPRHGRPNLHRHYDLPVRNLPARTRRPHGRSPQPQRATPALGHQTRSVTRNAPHPRLHHTRLRPNRALPHPQQASQRPLDPRPRPQNPHAPTPRTGQDPRPDLPTLRLGRPKRRRRPPHAPRLANPGHAPLPRLPQSPRHPRAMTSVPDNATLCACGSPIGSWSKRPRNLDCPKCKGYGWYVSPRRETPDRGSDTHTTTTHRTP
jgi:hypothetical protein